MTDINKAVKNLYDRAYRRGLNVSKKDIEAKVLEISSTGELTDEQKAEIVEFFASQAEAGVNQDSLPNEPDFVGEYAKAEEPVQSSALASPQSKPPASVLSVSEARNIVFDQCEQLEIELKSSDIKEIANYIHEASLDAEAAVNYTKTVLTQFITVTENRFTSSLTESMQELVTHANNSFRRREATTTAAFGKLKEDLAVSTATYKRSTQAYTNDLAEYFQDTFAQ